MKGGIGVVSNPLAGGPCLWLAYGFGEAGWIRSLPIVAMVVLGGGIAFLALLPALRRFGSLSRTRGGVDGADNGSAP
jgi:hypothetical protein